MESTLIVGIACGALALCREIIRKLHKRRKIKESQKALQALNKIIKIQEQHLGFNSIFLAYNPAYEFDIKSPISKKVRKTILDWFYKVFQNPPMFEYFNQTGLTFISYYHLTEKSKRANYFKKHINPSEITRSMYGFYPETSYNQHTSVLPYLSQDDNISFAYAEIFQKMRRRYYILEFGCIEIYHLWRILPRQKFYEIMKIRIFGLSSGYAGYTHYLHREIIEANKKFSSQPTFSHNPIILARQEREEWLKCYFVLALDCSWPILGTLYNLKILNN